MFYEKQQSQSRITVPEANVLVAKVPEANYLGSEIPEANVPDCSYKVVGTRPCRGFLPYLNGHAQVTISSP